MSSSEQPEPQESVTSGQSTSQKAKSEADLVIKNPTDGPGTLPFVLSLPVSTTVERLKNELCTKYPGSPSVETQRLIYAGKLLSDSQKLREFLSPHQQNGTPHTIHLVISAPQPPQSFSQASTTQNSSPTVNDNADSSPDAQPPRLPPFAYNGQLFGGQAPRIPLHLQEVEYAEHLQLVESLLAQTLQNAAGTPPDPRLLAQMQQAADMAAAAAAAAAAGSQNVRAQPYATAPPLAPGNVMLPGMVPMHPQMPVQHVPPVNMADPRTLQQNMQQPPTQQGNDANPQRARQAGQPRRFNGFQLDVQIGRAGLQNGARNGVNVPNQPHVRQFVFQLEINWALIAKLFFLVYLLGHEGNSRRMYSLIVAAIAIYLWQTGHLGWLRRFVNMALPNPRHLIEHLFPQQPSSENEDAAGNTPARSNPYGYPAIMLSFIYSFIYGFVCSLLPAWNPQPLPRIEQIVQNPEHRHEEAARNANHEHVE
ncbi:Homocysteine-responsive endoplasmic reticulum-resident ubiquitin-like domain member 2 protein [Gracilariopsis chorda]|uniref:Homocysteine-responsive endoplasmic reticulum-resident ubiquitin-like domain member 2 protein n=1 Tax=Gracilariopsis chorda TaxID=448386 RepID=A0A2V3IQ72_9FLOR|nr:Homocysteine-responsive endoplasmic reticulum-resident ubiquitin-like domain member 2 protein [Gracilariopsis chorda]|eukprot:PXF43280.1 Homocysteine-responsive endoplasmic reticulum-resident ubiquitin-like domain member 2 protein [Gracilariopsis chorda]